jgi:hypothetical protein
MKGNNIVASYPVSIFIAGDLGQIRGACRRACMQGLCVTVSPIEYIFTGGSESGAIIGLINYPRFPASETEIKNKAIDLAFRLMDDCCQRSCTLQTPIASMLLTNPKLESIPR